jgi:hypothetical protein
MVEICVKVLSQHYLEGLKVDNFRQLDSVLIFKAVTLKCVAKLSTALPHHSVILIVQVRGNIRRGFRLMI